MGQPWPERLRLRIHIWSHYRGPTAVAGPRPPLRIQRRLDAALPALRWASLPSLSLALRPSLPVAGASELRPPGPPLLPPLSVVVAFASRLLPAFVFVMTRVSASVVPRDSRRNADDARVVHVRSHYGRLTFSPSRPLRREQQATEPRIGDSLTARGDCCQPLPLSRWLDDQKRPKAEKPVTAEPT